MTAGLSAIQRGYARAARAWAEGAELAYVPMADALLDLVADRLDGATVIDAGAATGAVSRLAAGRGAAPVACDASWPMLAYRSRERPPAVVGDIVRLPVANGSFDGAAAAFVLNHLEDPVAGLVELSRVVRSGGFVLASVFSTADQPPAKAAIDGELARAGWTPPDWYAHVKQVDGRLGSADRMRDAATAAGLEAVDVVERSVDTGVSDPVEVVRFRFSQPHVTAFLQRLDAEELATITRTCVEAVAAAGTRLAPGVVALSATG